MGRPKLKKKALKVKVKTTLRGPKPRPFTSLEVKALLKRAERLAEVEGNITKKRALEELSYVLVRLSKLNSNSHQPTFGKESTVIVPAKGSALDVAQKKEEAEACKTPSSLVHSF